MTIQVAIRMTTIVSLALGLSACGRNFGPVAVQLQASQKFELQSTSGKSITFEAGKTVPAMASYRAYKSVIQLAVAGEKFQFKNAKFDKDLNQVVVLPTDSSQGVGVTVNRSLVCNPDCEHRHVYQYWQTCTYYVNDYGRRCRHYDGQLECGSRWGSRPVPGRQWMESVVTTRTYSVQANLTDLSFIEIAKAVGTYQDQSRDIYPISSCF